MRKTDGFTLIEMLVVVAVIGVLAALLFPALGTARGRAQTSGCAANLRQIGMALNSYATDNGGRLPPHTIPNDNDFAYSIAVLGKKTQYWCDEMLLGQYCGNLNSFGRLDQKGGGSVFKCPSDTQPRAPHRPGNDEVYTSYAYNALLYSTTNNIWGVNISLDTLPTGMGRYSRPAKTLFVVDGAWINFHPGYGNNPPCYGVTEPFNSNQWTPGDPTSIVNWMRRHREQRGANLLFLDGHVEYTDDMKQLVDDGDLIFTPDA